MTDKHEPPVADKVTIQEDNEDITQQRQERDSVSEASNSTEQDRGAQIELYHFPQYLSSIVSEAHPEDLMEVREHLQSEENVVNMDPEMTGMGQPEWTDDHKCVAYDNDRHRGQ